MTFKNLLSLTVTFCNLSFQRNFMCRSAEYNYVTLQCRLSDYDRRTAEANLQPVELVEAAGVDYFENLCLSSEWKTNKYINRQRDVETERQK